jgi:hypothetical protein
MDFDVGGPMTLMWEADYFDVVGLITLMLEARWTLWEARWTLMWEARWTLKWEARWTLKWEARRSLPSAPTCESLDSANIHLSWFALPQLIPFPHSVAHTSGDPKYNVDGEGGEDQSTRNGGGQEADINDWAL